MKATAKFRASKRLRFADTKRIMSPDMSPKSFGTFEKQAPGARFSKVPRTFRARKAILKLRPAYSVKLVCSYVVERIKINITAKFLAARRLHFEDRKRIMSPDLRPKSFGTFEKQPLGSSCSKHG